jgi:hypothetical protein
VENNAGRLILTPAKYQGRVAGCTLLPSLPALPSRRVVANSAKTFAKAGTISRILLKSDLDIEITRTFVRAFTVAFREQSVSTAISPKNDAGPNTATFSDLPSI